MTLWRANCVRRISADSRTFIYFRRRCCAKNLVGIPQYVIAHHGWFETPDPALDSHENMGADQANHRIELSDKLLYPIVSMLSLLVIKHRGLGPHEPADLTLPVRGWVLFRQGPKMRCHTRSPHIDLRVGISIAADQTQDSSFIVIGIEDSWVSKILAITAWNSRGTA
jgi:hypothetical protein